MESNTKPGTFIPSLLIPKAVKDLFASNLADINARLKTKWTSFNLRHLHIQTIVGFGVNYKGQVTGDDQTNATIYIYQPISKDPNVPAADPVVASTVLGWGPHD